MSNNQTILIYLNKTNLCWAMHEQDSLRAYTRNEAVEGVVNKDFFLENIKEIKRQFPDCYEYIIGVDDKKTMLAPYYWTDTVLKQEFEILHGSDIAEELVSQHIDWQNYKGYFSIKKTSKALFSSSSKDATIINNHISLINFYQKYILNIDTNNKYVVCINKSFDNFCATIFIDKSLHLHNVYFYESKNDIDYFLESIYKHFKVDLNEVTLYTSNLQGINFSAGNKFEIESLIPFTKLLNDEDRKKEYIVNLLSLIA